MSLSFCVLGSGSSGNSTLVALEGGRSSRFILIDCGLSPRQTAKRLAPLGITLDQISDILLTHLDRDHFYLTWARAIERYDITLHAHQRHRSRAMDCEIDFARLELFNGHVRLDETTEVQTIALAHDDLGTVGFLLEHAGMRFGFATDLGRVPKQLYERFVDLNALAMESNYDREMQLSSGRPAYLKKRIMGGRGHLSNEQSLEAVLRIADCSRLSQIALLHLSRQCNCPRLVTSLYAREARHLLDGLTVTNQYQPTPLLHVTECNGRRRPPRPDEQLALF